MKIFLQNKMKKSTVVLAKGNWTEVKCSDKSASFDEYPKLLDDGTETNL